MLSWGKYLRIIRYPGHSDGFATGPELDKREFVFYLPSTGAAPQEDPEQG
jgi:hypothetical protein